MKRTATSMTDHPICVSPTPATGAMTDPLLKNTALPSAPSHIPSLITASICGAIFGFVIHKGRVFDPNYIFDQMVFKHFVMLKMFLAAAALSLVVTASLVLAGKQNLVAGARKWAFNGYRGAYAAILGGLILGVGMSVSGACPGTGPVQIGSGVKWAILTFIGGLFGAFSFGYLEPCHLQKAGILKMGMFKKPTLDAQFNMPFPVVAFLMAALFGGIALITEALVPWKTDISVPAGAELGLGLTSYAWPPIVSGVVVGLLQLPMLLVIHDTLGASRAYVTLFARAINASPLRKVCDNPYFAGCSCGTSNWTQVAYVLFSIVGGFIASLTSAPVSFGSAPGFGMFRSFIGGFLTVWGGRLAGGCTSGQGLSGNAVLGCISPLATMAMFAGAIPTALIMSHF